MRKVIILGAGQVGSSVASSLVSEDNDITIIDLDAKKLKVLADRFDLRTLQGNAGHPSVLIEAGVQDCELLIAVTEVDEVNMLACRIAHVLFNVPNRIARIRAIEYLENDQLSDGTLFDISHVICPEQVLTDYLLKLVAFPEALQVCWWVIPFRICHAIYPMLMRASWRFSARAVRFVLMDKRSCAQAMKFSFFPKPATCAR
jgi:trk system potassium uptake protein TrkA